MVSNDSDPLLFLLLCHSLPLWLRLTYVTKKTTQNWWSMWLLRLRLEKHCGLCLAFLAHLLCEKLASMKRKDPCDHKWIPTGNHPHGFASWTMSPLLQAGPIDFVKTSDNSHHIDIQTITSWKTLSKSHPGKTLLKSWLSENTWLNPT